LCFFLLPGKMSRRAVIEAFKYLTAAEILTSAVFVNSTWQAAAYSDDVLLCLLHSEEEEPHNKALPLYQRVKKAKKSLGYLLHASEGVLSVWHISEASRKPKTVSRPFFTSSSRYVLTDHSTALMTGGLGFERVCVSVELRSGAVTEEPALLRKHAKHGLAVLKEAVYISGGDIGRSFVRYAEKFASGKWERIEDMTTERYNHTLCSYDRRIYAFGGSNTTGYLQSVEYYDQTWTSAPMALPTPRNFPSLLPLKGGLLLVGGYYPSSSRRLVHLWDQSAGNWQEVCETTTNYSLSNAVGVRNGLLYVYSHNKRRDSLPLPVSLTEVAGLSPRYRSNTVIFPRKPVCPLL